MGNWEYDIERDHIVWSEELFRIYGLEPAEERFTVQMLADRVLANPKVRVEWNSTLEDILGEDFVTGVQLKDTVTGEVRALECKGVFMAIGHTPNTGFLGDSVPLKPTGYMIVEAGATRTSVPGVFGAGDVMDDTYRQAVTAAGTGCMAALEAEKWLLEGE